MAGLGIGRGDEVIVPAFTAVPTASAVCAVGGTPVLVDVDEWTAAIDPLCAAAAISARTKAVVVVHLYGRPAPVDPLLELGVPVIEDAAQAHGALRGVAGTAAIYSFYPTKNVGGRRRELGHAAQGGDDARRRADHLHPGPRRRGALLADGRPRRRCRPVGPAPTLTRGR